LPTTDQAKPPDETRAWLAQEAAADKSAQEYALKKRKAKDAGVDLTIFGMSLYEPLSLPACDQEMGTMDFFSALGGIGRGGATTCAGDPGMMAANAFLQLGAAMMGQKARQSSDILWTPVRLADDRCPDWMRTGGSCAVFVATDHGIFVGAKVTTGIVGDVISKIDRAMTRKYGKPPADGATSIVCRNTLTGIAVDEAGERLWDLPGLQVSYLPLNGDCRRGLLKVSTAALFELEQQQVRAQEAAEPTM